MSQRESRLTPVALSSIGGVNQRLMDTELPPQEYSLVEGLFPEFAGLQGRLFGKRLLKKYASSIYGIHQFWTPYGYGAGLYQFDDSVDFGPWLTPTTEIVLPPLKLPVDGGGFTIEEFGQNPWLPPNVCVLSFLNGSTNHEMCLDPIESVGTPDDNNGGPGGGGRTCAWVAEGEPVEMALPPLAVSGFTGSNGFSVLNTEPPFNEPYSPIPLPRRLPDKYNIKPTYVDGGESFTASASSISTMGQVPFIGYNFRYEGNANAGAVVIDFSPVVDLGHLPGRADIFVEHLNLVGAWEGVWIAVPIHFDGDVSDYRYDSYKLDLWDYIVQGRVTVENGFNGYTLTDSVRVLKARFIFRVRVCHAN